MKPGFPTTSLDDIKMEGIADRIEDGNDSDSVLSSDVMVEDEMQFSDEESRANDVIAAEIDDVSPIFDFIESDDDDDSTDDRFRRTMAETDPADDKSAFEAAPASNSSNGSIDIRDNAEEAAPSNTQRNWELLRLKENRSNMAIFHFLITVPRWSFSLFVWISSLVVPLSTLETGINHPLERLRKVVDLESSSYASCVDRSFANAQTRIKNDIDDEVVKINAAQNENAQLISQMESIGELCLSNLATAKEGLQRWRDVNSVGLSYVSDASTCSDGDRQRTIDILGEEQHDAESNVASIFAKYVQASELSLESIASYAQDRTAYDVSYFVTERLAPALDVVQHFSPTDDIHVSANYPRIESHIFAALQDFERAINVSIAEAEQLQGRAGEFLDSIHELQVWYEDMYARLEKAHNFVTDILPPGIPSPSYFDTSDIPLSLSLLPTTTSIPPTSTTYEATRELVMSTVLRLLGIFNVTIDDVGLRLSLTNKASLDNLTQSISSVLALDEYDPPQFEGSNPSISSPFEEIEVHRQVGVDAGIDIQSGLDELGDLLTLPNATKPTISILGPGSFQRDDGKTSFSYLSTQFPRFEIPDILSAFFGSVTSNTWAPEIVLQAFRLWRLERIYANGAIPDTPEIDFGFQDKIKDQSSVATLLMHILTRAITSPWTVLLLMALPICLCAILFWRPVVNEGCDEYHPRGTFLANDFAVPVLANQANLQGNSQYSKHEVQCTETVRLICNEMNVENMIAFRSTQSMYDDAVQQHRSAQDETLLLKNCIADDLNADFHLACCGLRGYPDCFDDDNLDQWSHGLQCPVNDDTVPMTVYPPLSFFTSQATCTSALEFPKLHDTNLDCSRFVESCRNIPCNGINVDLIREETIKSDCEVENYLIKCCEFTLLVLFNAMCINIICILLFRGLRQIYWRSLCPARLMFRTQVNEAGEIIKGGSAECRRKRIEIATARFEITSRLEVVFAATFFLLWVVMLLIL